MSTPKYAIAPCDGLDITAGKAYEIFDLTYIEGALFSWEKTLSGFFIKDDVGDEIFCRVEGSFHLNGLDWILK